MALIGMPPRRLGHGAPPTRHIDPKSPEKHIPATVEQNVPDRLLIEGPVEVAMVSLVEAAGVPSMGRDEFRALLKRAGFSQVEFAAHIGVHMKTVSRWALGQWPVPRLVVMYLEMRLASGERDA